MRIVLAIALVLVLAGAAAAQPAGTPTITALSPASVAVNEPALTLEVAGTNFAPSAVVLWNGGSRATTFVSATLLRAAIPAGDLGAPGAATVTVVSPVPDGNASNAVRFSVTPLKATLYFCTPALQGPPSNIACDTVPPDTTFVAGQPTPRVALVLQIQNVSGAPVLTTERFSSTDFFRRLYFTDPTGGTLVNTAEAAVHGQSRLFMCFSRRGVLQRSAIPVVPVEVLGGAGLNDAANFFREYVIQDARTLFDLSRPGTYRVNARIPLQTFAATDPAAVFGDCDQLRNITLANVGAITGREELTIVSNTLEFSVKPTPPSTVASFAPPLASPPAWNLTDVTATFTTASPSGAVVERIVVSTTNAGVTTQQSLPGPQASLTITNEGVTTLTYHAEDSAGVVEAEKTATVRIDKAPPVITLTSPQDGATYDVGQPVPASYGCSDANGCTAVGPVPTGSLIDTATAGVKTFTVTATDGAGRTASRTVTYTVGNAGVDTIPPTTTASAIPAWSNVAVPVTLTAVDNAGGTGVRAIGVLVFGAQFSGTGVFPGATTTVVVSSEGLTRLLYAALDNANPPNVEFPRLAIVRIDKTAPEIDGMPQRRCTLSNNGRLVEIADVTASDPTSNGVASGVAPGSRTVVVTASPPAPSGDIVITGGVVKVRATQRGRIYTVTATAKDVAGNTATETGTCTVR